MSNTDGNKAASFGGFITRFINVLKPLINNAAPTVQPHHAPPPTDNTTEPVKNVTSKVLLAIYNPTMDPVTGKGLIETMNYNDPDALVNDFIQDILEVSGGLARFEVVQRVVVTGIPVLTDGYTYDPQTLLAVLHKTQPAHPPAPVYANYETMLNKLNVLPQVASGAIDEVWLMGYPESGFYESAMCGAGAFPCNCNVPMTWSETCPRRFVVMGFSSERGVGEMLHSFGHRVEAIMAQTCSKPPKEGVNLYAQFSLYDQVSPDKAQMGTIHFPPNAQSPYDYNNPRMVLSNCYDWYNFPTFRNDIRLVNADEWGNGDLRILHKWWLNHLPKVAGRTSGVMNNWWQYVMDANLVMV